MVWNANKTLSNGKYTIKNVLGEGGFGVTYLAVDSNENVVVIKTLNDAVQMRPDFSQFHQDFMNEALRLAKCNHLHIVKVYEVIQEENLWCMVMEYGGRNDLASLINQNQYLPEKNALYFTKQIGRALDYVHDLGILHRDIKPNNILIKNHQGKAQALLIDFGIAREFQQNLTQSQTPILTDGFAPIEQYDKRAKRGAFTDVYALAATLYTMVTGQIPTPATVRSVYSLTPPQELNPNISDRANKAILKGMELIPENRPQSIKEWFGLLGLSTQSKTPANQVPSTNPQVASTFYSQKQVKPKSKRLTSQIGIDYTQLKNFLAARRWQDADLETRLILLRLTGKEKTGKLRIDDLPKIPAEDLQIIDRLWVKYSDGHFGFSVQTRLWEASGRNIIKFAKIIGWWFIPDNPQQWDPRFKFYETLNFSTSSPRGHLPVFGSIGLRITPSDFLDRLFCKHYQRIFDYFRKCGL